MPEVVVLTVHGEDVTEVKRKKHQNIISTRTKITARIQERYGDNSRYRVKDLPILQLDRKTCAEALDIMYRECTFAITLSLWNIPTLPGTLFQTRVAQKHFLLASWLRGQEPLQVPQPLLKARNWLITLHWSTRGCLGNAQPKDIREEVMCIADMLKENKEIDTITLKYPCQCSFRHGGYDVFVEGCRWLGEGPGYRGAREIESRREIAGMLSPLTGLQVAKKATLIPTVFAQTAILPFKVYPYEEEYCRSLTEPIERVIQGEQVSRIPVFSLNI
ncbi:MAG: hypothetical protein Q9218_007441 [Villophora microphyllina]